ncbi:MAG TPA: KH domain-containing protein [Synechococcales cyanobacterium M55_K2018_004]|nr:KH domain-containing protein [Synechococcales cyanobacterium M55_K2018_004]
MSELTSATSATAESQIAPNYVELVKFLVGPFLESPDRLKVDCEVVQSRMRVLLRVAFDGEDKGRVFGRGGRNIQAIRTVMQAIAQIAGYTLHLEVFGSSPAAERNGGAVESPPERRASGTRKSPPRPSRPRT